MVLPHVVIKPSARHGFGIFAGEPIPMGTVVWHPCARCPVFSPADVAALGSSQRAQLDEYGYFLEDGGQILPCTVTFFANHACHANVLDYGVDFGIAVKDIAAGEEITGDYRTFASDPPWEVSCACGFPDCAGVVGPRYVTDRLTAWWTAKVGRAVAELARVPQPLAASLTADSAAFAAARTPGFRPDPARFSIRQRRSG